MAELPIVAIGQPVESQLRERLEASLLRPTDGKRVLPSALLWGDDAALQQPAE